MTDTTLSKTQAAAPQGVLRPYLRLLKPRVMSLAIFTALGGMIAAPGSLDPAAALAALVFIAIGAGAAGALNMWYDADIDRVMSRTAMRPIPRSQVTPKAALAFGLALASGSVLGLGALVNWTAGGLLALTIAYYVLVYTMWLKRTTAQSIVIGGAAGAFPPMIGWAAMTGGVALDSVILFAIIFLWTPPHFWALGLLRARDYERAGIPMHPVVHGRQATRVQILVYTVLTALCGLAPFATGLGGPLYFAAAAVLGAIFIYYALIVLLRGDGARADKAAFALFSYSIFYLFALFAVLIVEHGLGLV